MSSSETLEFRISFLTNNPLSSDFVHARSGEKLYSITTDVQGLAKDVTVIHDAQGEAFAEWEPRSFGPDYVKFHGERCKVSEWLPKKNILSKLAAWCMDACYIR